MIEFSIEIDDYHCEAEDGADEKTELAGEMKVRIN